MYKVGDIDLLCRRCPRLMLRYSVSIRARERTYRSVACRDRAISSRMVRVLPTDMKVAFEGLWRHG